MGAKTIMTSQAVEIPIHNLGEAIQVMELMEAHGFSCHLIEHSFVENDSMVKMERSKALTLSELKAKIIKDSVSKAIAKIKDSFNG